MESSPLGSQYHNKEHEWHLRARISRDNTSSSSSRYNASYIRSFREDSRTSFKSNFSIPSTASSPGYNFKDKIDPSTYSFTTALKALQAKSGYVWECLSPEGYSLNSKWDEAERYICNPLSGEVPMECLSAKTLSGRSFRSYMASRVTISAPIVYSMQPRLTTISSTLYTPSNNNNNNNKSLSVTVTKKQLVMPPSLGQEENKILESKTRHIGTQSTSIAEDTSSCPSPISTPSIKERKIKCFLEAEDRETIKLSSTIKLDPLQEVKGKVLEETKRRRKESVQIKKKKSGQLCFSKKNNGCLQLSSWSCLWMDKKRKKITSPKQLDNTLKLGV